MSLGNLLRTGSYIDLDYVYGTLTNRGGENPLDFEAFRKSPAQMRVVALNALDGSTIYFGKDDVAQDDYNILKASSCIPVVCRPYFVNGVPCYDGGLADPVPLKKAFADGCDRVVVILTKPWSFRRSRSGDERLARILRRKYPKAAEQLLLRYRKYNRGVDLAKIYEQEGKALIIAPDSISGMSTLTKDRNVMDRLYHKGYRDAAAIPEFLARGPEGPA